MEPKHNAQHDKFKEAVKELGCEEKVKCLSCEGSGIANEIDIIHFHKDDDHACKNCKGKGWL